jgi:hypothetical protein
MLLFFLQRINTLKVSLDRQPFLSLDSLGFLLLSLLLLLLILLSLDEPLLLACFCVLLSRLCWRLSQMCRVGVELLFLRRLCELLFVLM